MYKNVVYPCKLDEKRLIKVINPTFLGMKESDYFSIVRLSVNKIA